MYFYKKTKMNRPTHRVTKWNFAFTLFLLLIGNVCFAHPHIFIETDITVVFAPKKIEKLEVKLSFDKIFSADLRQNFDANNNGIFEQSEITNIEQNAFANLVNYNYLVHIQDNGKSVKLESVEGFTAKIENGVVNYYFTAEVNIPAGKSAKKVKISSYDHTYYMDVGIKVKHTQFKNTPNFKYTWTSIDDRSQAYYYEQIYPKTLILSIN